MYTCGLLEDLPTRRKRDSIVRLLFGPVEREFNLGPNLFLLFVKFSGGYELASDCFEDALP